jgi:uncharacterized membrane protein YebE (DUF533 family)
MRGWKIVAIAVGALVAFLLVGTVIHVIISALITVAVVAAIAGAIYVAIKVSRSNKQVSGKQKDHEVRDRHPSSNALESFDLDRYSAPTPTPRPAQRASAQDVDDELARLKREMGS